MKSKFTVEIDCPVVINRRDLEELIHLKVTDVHNCFAQVSVTELTELTGPKKAGKVQRIKLRLYKHPVKHDGTIVEFAHDGSWLVVEFDGPLPNMMLWQYGDTLLTDQEPVRYGEGAACGPAAGARLWEVI